MEAVLYPLFWLALLGLIATLHYRWQTKPTRSRTSRPPVRCVQESITSVPTSASLPLPEGCRDGLKTCCDSCNALQNPNIPQGTAVASGGLAPPVLGAADWLAIVNHRPDDVPHLAVFGPSGVGKTTLVQGILTLRTGHLIIIDPKPRRPGQMKWGGLPYVRIDRDGTYRSIEKTLRSLLREINRRLVALEEGQDFEPITVVIDEYKLLVRECKEAAPSLYVKLSDIGRELRMRLVVISTTQRVRGLGIEGLGDTRENFVVIELDRQHRATLDWDDATYELDTRAVVDAAHQPIPATRLWSPPTAPSTALECENATTTTTVTDAQNNPVSPVVVGNVTLSEQMSILHAALAVQQEAGKVSRSEVCRRVFDGATGGAAYNKVKLVLDAANL